MDEYGAIPRYQMDGFGEHDLFLNNGKNLLKVKQLQKDICQAREVKKLQMQKMFSIYIKVQAEEKYSKGMVAMLTDRIKPKTYQ